MQIIHDEILQRALDFASDKARIHYILSLSLRARGRIDEAKRSLERARALDPDIVAPDRD